MFFFLRSFLLFIALYHIIATFLVYGSNSWLTTSDVAIAREIIWILFSLICFILWLKNKKVFLFLKATKKSTIALIVLFAFSIVMSILLWKSWYSIMIWIKYSLRYLCIFYSSVYIGFYIDKKNEHLLINFTNRIIKLVSTIIVVWLMWQITKHIFPNIFSLMWYGAVWDFVFWSNPPIYYRTWPWWFPRLSWIFSWPNNYGYFFVAYAGIIFLMSQLISPSNHIKKLLACFVSGISLLRTFSRWALLVVFIQASIFFRDFFKKKKKMFFGVIAITLSVFIWLSVFKWSSTLEHITQKWKWIAIVIQQPFWFWLGTAGPAIHHEWTLLPENFYLQLMADIGVIGTIIRIYRWLLFFWHVKQIKQASNQNHINKKIYLMFTMMTLGLFWLFIEWLFLHVFEDSMINYLFFVPYGIFFWYLLQQNEITFQKNKQKV